jgi:hypothetical protein
VVVVGEESMDVVVKYAVVGVTILGVSEVPD